MAILDVNSIKLILENKPNATLISKAIDKSNIYKRHTTGEGAEDYLQEIEGYENITQRDLRRKLFTSNKSVFSKCLKHLDRVFTAKGGFTSYNLSDNQTNTIKNALNNVNGGLSLNDYLFSKTKMDYINDPNGIILIETEQDGSLSIDFKSSDTIFDYQKNGNRLEYIIFNPKINTEKNTQTYRVIDDAFDYDIVVSKDSVIIDPENIFVNQFGYVPAYIVGNECSQEEVYPQSQIKLFDSFISNTTEVADEVLWQNSVRIIHTLSHGYSKYWEYAQSCVYCKGSGYIPTDDGETECPSCFGTGVNQRTKPSDKIVLSVPTDREDTVIAPNIAGFVSPDMEIWRQYNSDLKDLRDDIYEVIWGTAFVSEKNETATGRFIDTQPISDRLNVARKAFQNITQFVIDSYGVYLFSNPSYESSVSLGDRYFIESSDEILRIIIDSSDKPIPVLLKNKLTIKYLESEYQSNSFELQKSLKLASVEPLPYLTPEQILVANVSESDKQQQYYFHQWINEINEFDIITKTEEQLKQDLLTFTNNKTNAGLQSTQGGEGAIGDGEAN